MNELQTKMNELEEFIKDKFGSRMGWTVESDFSGTFVDIAINFAYAFETGRQLGKFTIEHKDMKDIELLRVIQKDLVILETVWHYDRVEFTAVGDQFEYVQPEQVIPEYEVRIVKDYPDTLDREGNCANVSSIIDIEFWRK